MGRETDILFDLIKIWSGQNELYSKQCTVSSVNESERTCVALPVDGSPELFDVRLEADYTDATATDSKGFFVVPAVDSLVVVTFLSPTEAFVSAWTQIDKVIATQGEWIFNGGLNDGLVVVGSLTSKLNAIESDLNTLKNLVSAWVPVPTDGGASLKVTLATWYASLLTQTAQSDIENTDVKH